MLAAIQDGLIGQFDAALNTLRDAIDACPENCWHDNVGNFPFWHVSYHVLFYADLYLTKDHESFVPPAFFRENYQYFDRFPDGVDGSAFVADVPYDRATLLAYADHCLAKSVQSIRAETAESLQGDSGFFWYQIPRFEFHVNNIRHIQHHAAQLSLFVRKTDGSDVPWRGGRKTR